MTQTCIRILLFFFLILSSNILANNYIKLESSGRYFNNFNEEITELTHLSATETEIHIESANWELDFSAPLASPFTAKASYLGVSNYPFGSDNKAKFKIDWKVGRCSDHRGEYFIYEYDIDSEVPKIALDFKQYCGGFSGTLNGQIRINSDIPVPYGEPFIVIAPTPQLVEGGSILMDATKSFSSEPFSGTTNINSFFWRQISGPEITLSNPNISTPSITAPEDIKLEGEIIELELTVFDELNQSAEKNIRLDINSKSAPLTYVLIEPITETWITGGKPLFFDLSNDKIELSYWSDKSISVDINGFDWSIQFDAPNDDLLAIGEYADAGNYPFQEENQAGISFSGNGKACSEDLGNFVISTLEYGQNNKPLSFAATFEVHCREIGNGTIRGEIFYNAKHPSVPIANAGQDITIEEGKTVSLNGNGSTDSKGEIIEYLWSTDDSSIVINNNGSSNATFIAPDVTQNTDISINLTVKDNEGFKSQDIVKVTVTNGSTTESSSSDSSSGGSIHFLLLSCFVWLLRSSQK
ncbi:PKD domain-containing protein [Thalassotalea ganghwensis]